jgi:membrane protein required for colicin V production
VVIFLLGKLIHKLVNIIALGFLNRLAGGIFGLLKCALVLSVILYFFNGFDQDSSILNNEVKQESYLYDPVESIVPMIIPRLNIVNLDIPEQDGIPEII